MSLVFTATKPMDATMSREVTTARITTVNATYRTQVSAFAKLARGPRTGG
jgi:hypothetical protein